jgi:hypothetical protein
VALYLGEHIASLGDRATRGVHTADELDRLLAPAEDLVVVLGASIMSVRSVATKLLGQL